MKLMIPAALSAALLLNACAAGVERYDSPQAARQAALGKDYLITRYHGNLPGVENSPPALWTPLQYRQLQSLQGDCVEDLTPQVAGTKWKSIGKETAQTAIGSGIGVAVGSLAFTGANAMQYGAYGAGAGAGNGFPYGADRHQEAMQYEMGYCMDLQVYYAQVRDGQLSGIGIIPQIDAVDTNAVPMPQGASASPTADEAGRTRSNARFQAPPQ